MFRKPIVPMSALIAALALLGCDRGHATSPAPATAASAPTLRTYQVPPGYGPKVRPILSGLLKGGDNEPAVGRAALAPDDRLVVLAPESVQDGVKSLLDDLAKNKGTTTAPPTVTITHWLVVAKAEPLHGPEECGPRGLQCLQGGPELVKALEAVAASQGPAGDRLSFVLLEKLSVRAIDSEFADLEGAHARVKQRASVANGKILADVSIDVQASKGSGAVRTQLQFAPNQTVVLGQVAYEERNGGGKDKEKDTTSDSAGGQPGMLLFVTRGTVEE